MKKLVLLLLLVCSLAAEAQPTTVLILYDTADWQTLSFKRGMRGNYIWIPTWDANAKMFFTLDVLQEPKLSDVWCLIDSLTYEGPYVPLMDENLRYYQASDKLAFIEWATLAGANVQQNNIGDVIVNQSLYELFQLYPNVYEAELQKAELIDRWTEMWTAGTIWPITYPPVITPPYTGCN